MRIYCRYLLFQLITLRDIRAILQPQGYGLQPQHILLLIVRTLKICHNYEHFCIFEKKIVLGCNSRSHGTTNHFYHKSWCKGDVECSNLNSGCCQPDCWTLRPEQVTEAEHPDDCTHHVAFWSVLHPGKFSFCFSYPRNTVKHRICKSLLIFYWFDIIRLTRRVYHRAPFNTVILSVTSKLS